MTILSTLTYGVVLSGYCSEASGPRLTPLVLCCVRAESEQDAVYLVMEQCSLLCVDRAEVILPDGAVWSRNSVFYKNVYDVAAWETDLPSWETGLCELPIFDNLVQADSPLLAALTLMQHNSLDYVARVAVRCPDGSDWRKEHLKIEKDEEGETL